MTLIEIEEILKDNSAGEKKRFKGILKVALVALIALVIAEKNTKRVIIKLMLILMIVIVKMSAMLVKT